LDGHT